MRYLCYSYILLVLLGCNQQTKKNEEGPSSASKLEGFIARPEVSPDGLQIVFIYAGNKDNTWELYLAEYNGTNSKQLTDFEEARIKKAPTWSPDGSRIAFHADINGGAQIFIIDVTGENMRQLTQLPGYNVEPSWSANGEYLFFNSIIEGKTQIVKVEIGTGNVRKVRSSNGNDWYPKHHDSHLIFSSDFRSKDHYQIYIENLGNGRIDQLTHLRGNANFPELSPNGTKIVFTSNRDDPNIDIAGDYNLYLIQSDGSQLQQLTDLPGQELHAKWFPSGDKVICEHYRDGKANFLVVDTKSFSVSQLQLYK